MFKIAYTVTMKNKPTIIGLIIICAISGTIAMSWAPTQKIYHAWQERKLLTEHIRGKLLRLRLPSKKLRRTNTIFVYLPPDYNPHGAPYPVIYLLHGFPGDARDWFVKGRAHETAEAKILAKQISPVILVSFDAAGPKGHRDISQYLDKPDGTCSVEDYITEELPHQIESLYNAGRTADDRAMIGLSAGGYGAVNIGTKHPNTFRALASHSGFFQLQDDAVPTAKWLGPPGPLWYANDPLKNAGNWKNDNKLHIYLDCGRSDDLLDENMRFSKRLRALKIDHMYNTYPGAHHWSYWREHFAQSLQFVDDAFEKLRRAKELQSR